jgi:hypothetical protein
MDQAKEVIDLKKRLIQFDEVIKMTQNLNSELHKKIENLEIENRTLEEEYHTLRDNYEHMKKRFEALQKEMLDFKTNMSKKSGMLDWIVNSGVKDENSKLKEKIHALETELNLKIQENEQIHIEIFEEKQNFNKIIQDLESEIEKMKFNINDKITELNSVSEKNSNLVSIQRTLENNLNNISESLKKTESELKLKESKWKNKKSQFKQEIDNKNKIQKNLLPINEYKDKNLNCLNFEYIYSHNFIQEYLTPSFKLFTNVMNNFSSVINSSDNFIELLIERFNYIYTNIDLKTEHRGYLFACDKLRFHSFTLQQIFRTIVLFSKILVRKFENLEKESSEQGSNINNLIMNILLNSNIILTLLNKSSVYVELLVKYYKILIKEERKISYNDEILDSSTKLKINKDLKSSLSLISANFSALLKKINLLTNFNLEYNLQNISVVSDNTSGIVIKVSKNYFKNYKYNSAIKLSQKFSVIESILKSDLLNIKKNFAEFNKHFILKSEIEYKIFEVIKEESKNKYNYPIINLSAFKMNNENIKKNLNNLSEFLNKLFSILGTNNTSSNNNLENISNSNTESIQGGNSSLSNPSQILNLLSTNSWELSSNIYIPFLLIFEKFEKKKNFNEELIKSYHSHEPAVDYEEAIRNKAILKEMQEKENLQSRDRENYLNKINEYEEDLKRYRDKLNEEKNLNDLLRMEMMNKRDRDNTGLTATSSNMNLSLSEIEEKESHSLEFEDFLKHQINISEIQYEILSDDVQSGKQRSTFKLSNNDRAIPLTKFTAQIENNQDVSVLYHRKIIEKLQRYASKVKNFDFKVLSNLHLEELKSENENKLSEFSKKYEEEISSLKLQLEQKDNNIFGYQQTIMMLNDSVNEYETKISEITQKYEDQIKSVKDQMKMKESSVLDNNQVIKNLNATLEEYKNKLAENTKTRDSEILSLKKIIEQKEGSITGFTQTISNLNNSIKAYDDKILKMTQKYEDQIKSYVDQIKSKDSSIYEDSQTIKKLNASLEEYKNKLTDNTKKYEEEIKSFKQIIEQKENNIYGYTQTITFLNEAVHESEEKISKLTQKYEDQIKSINEQMKSKESNEQEALKLADSAKKYEEEITNLKQIIEQKNNNIFGYTQTIMFLNQAASDLDDLKTYVSDCQKCKKYIKDE